MTTTACRSVSAPARGRVGQWFSPTTTRRTETLTSTFVDSGTTTSLHSESLVRDDLGRITSKTETTRDLDGTTDTVVFGYDYDTNGRVVEGVEGLGPRSHVHLHRQRQPVERRQPGNGRDLRRPGPLRTRTGTTRTRTTTLASWRKRRTRARARRPPTPTTRWATYGA